MIKGRFATGDDVAKLHHISSNRRQQLDALVAKVVGGTIDTRRSGKIVSGKAVPASAKKK
jgi:signal transduction histidine kinase